MAASPGLQDPGRCMEQRGLDRLHGAYPLAALGAADRLTDVYVRCCVRAGMRFPRHIHAYE